MGSGQAVESGAGGGGWGGGGVDFLEFDAFVVFVAHEDEFAVNAFCRNMTLQQ